MKNLLNDIPLNTFEIEKQIKNYKLDFDYPRLDSIENRGGLPLFIDTFYTMVLEDDWIPSQADFYQRYLKDNKNSKQIKILSDRQMIGLKGRIYRTYPSIVRDLHFGKLLQQTIDFDKIIYNKKLDAKDGVDILIRNRKYKYAINLYINTKRSQEHRARKIENNKFESDVCVELPVNLGRGKTVGEFTLYSYKHVAQMLGVIVRYYGESDDVNDNINNRESSSW